MRPLVPQHLHAAYFGKTVGPTDWEKGAGPGFSLQSVGTLPTMDTLADYFSEHILPAAILANTRGEYDGAWRAWLTFCFSQDAISKAFPVQAVTLRAFMTHLLLCQYASATIAKYLAAVLHRNRQFGGAPPLAYRELASWMKPLQMRLGVPKVPSLSLRPEHVHTWLCVGAPDPLLLRDILMVAVGTAGAMRPSELVGLDVCDWITDKEVNAYGEPLGDAVYVKVQKNDQARRGMFKRFSRNSSDPRLCIPTRIRAYMTALGLVRHADCRKWRGTAADQAYPCERCGRLFRRMRAFPGGCVPVREWPHAISMATVSAALQKLLLTMDVSPAGFTNKSMRRGGLTAAKKAGVPPALRKEQSGHKSAAHTAYESSSDSAEEEVVRQDDLPTERPRAGWQPEHLYRFSRAVTAGAGGVGGVQ